MEDDRQAGLAGDEELPLEEVLLPIPVRIGDEEVEADLADGRRPILHYQSGEGLQIHLGVPLQIDRMQSQGGVKILLLGAEIQQPAPPGRIHGRHQHAAHSQAASPGQNIEPVGIELLHIQVAMGIKYLQRCISQWKPPHPPTRGDKRREAGPDQG